MLTHYIYNILIFFTLFILKKNNQYLILLTYPFFLWYLPETGYDFEFYKEAFENIYFDYQAPLFYRTSAILTAEPGWFLYNGIISWITNNFRFFLIINFFICFFILKKIFSLLNINLYQQNLMFVLATPVIHPTIYFWSPRSSISFCLSLLALTYLHKKSVFLFLIFALMSILIHSQYIAIIFLVGLTIFIYDNKYFYKYRISSILIMSFSLLFIFFNLNNIIDFLDFLPSSKIIESKTHYLKTDKSSFRLASILSFVIFPILIFLNKNNLKKKGLFTLIINLYFFSLLINIVFINNSHVAGRLSRTSDYFLFIYLLSLPTIKNRSIYLLLLFVLILTYPFLFNTLYNFQY